MASCLETPLLVLAGPATSPDGHWPLVDSHIAHIKEWLYSHSLGFHWLILTLLALQSGCIHTR